jgi:hypothetical protein
MAEHCCELMDVYLNDEDNLVHYFPKFREYGIPVHDGGSSQLGIAFCPWCGTKLPIPLRNEWFKELEGRGYTDPDADEIPIEFQTDEWWKGKTW